MANKKWDVPPVHLRIKTVEDERRCVRAIQDYLNATESTLAAEDLGRAIELLTRKEITE